MRKIILFVVTALMVTACSVGNVSRSGGMDNQGYLQFVQDGDTSYSGGVTVTIDDNPAFTAKVDKIKKLGIKGNTYEVKTGTRHLKVEYKGKVLYEKNIIIATQETKQINLP
jgi:major membrane immunogen (membrane-anchored lipoprotein)